MPSPIRIVIVVNPGSGIAAGSGTDPVLMHAFGGSGFAATFVELSPDLDLRGELTRLIAEGATVVAAAGGDGTVNAVADAVIGHDVTFAVVPQGTLNHFARDVGIPLDVSKAAAVILSGHTMDVDVGTVNGRTFLNNSSVGLYPLIVRLREEHAARGARKWAVALWATMRVIRETAPLRVQLTIDGVDVTRSTPLVLIGNNEYKMSGIDAASRTSLQDGMLALYLVKTSGPWKLLRLVWRIVTGSARESGELAMVAAAAATIDVPDDPTIVELEVALDGEVTTMPLPLHYEIRKRALRVLAPTTS
ncbi:MAG TPA: diacylglycerol kinase family protein [Gemmatimonadaceae bacterium]|nr:diacylglycerol kinase family protein [Gemmatimonadaceae bacterium]